MADDVQAKGHREGEGWIRGTARDRQWRHSAFLLGAAGTVGMLNQG